MIRRYTNSDRNIASSLCWTGLAQFSSCFQVNFRYKGSLSTSLGYILNAALETRAPIHLFMWKSHVPFSQYFIPEHFSKMLVYDKKLLEVLNVPHFSLFQGHKQKLPFLQSLLQKKKNPIKTILLFAKGKIPRTKQRAISWILIPSSG